MELCYEFIEPHKTNNYAQQSTEVTFEDYGQVNRQQLINNLPNLGIAYNKEVFPERIVLWGAYHAISVHRMITKVGLEKIKPADEVLGRKPEKPKPKTIKVETGFYL